MRSPLLRAALTAAILLIAGGLLAVDTDNAWAKSQILENISSALADGSIDADQAALNTIYFMFDQSKVDHEFFVRDDMRVKCGTHMIQDILNDDAVSREVKAVLNDYLNQSENGGSRAYYYPPGGHFRLGYATSGDNVVPLTDADASGTPDFVEWCGEYMDYSWQVEIDEAGFMAPAISGSHYSISFENLSGIYGYTTPVSGTTRISLHHTFLGFPPNDDPEGNQKGAAKVTCAHEFKHASQYTNNHWSEGGWDEVDATWTEEFVYPTVNDYHNYIAYTGSPLYNPEQSLDQGGTGSYEDCIWQQGMSEMYGLQIMLDLWDYRRAHSTYSMLNSYRAVLQMHGSDLEPYMAAWVRWNYMTGVRGRADFGYPDSPSLYTCRTAASVYGLGTARTWSIPHLATRYGRHYSVGNIEGYPKVVINASTMTSADFRPSVIVRKLDGTFAMFDLPLDASGDGELILSTPFSDLIEIGIALPNCKQSGSAYAVTYQLFAEEEVTGINPLPIEAVRNLASYPNPFNPQTKISFDLTAESQINLQIISAGGRVLRTLLSNEYRAEGHHEVVFDGTDDAGNILASGVYFARIDMGNTNWELTKLTLVK
ncbi:MAG: hypothetical protein GY835_15340 [bacterium]|nr:hypothetical protein [bacterium]